jgi:hypothetical protein
VVGTRLDRIERILEVLANTHIEMQHDFAVLHRTLDIMREALRRLLEKLRADQL